MIIYLFLSHGNLDLSRLPGHKTITFRSTKNISVDSFLSDLGRVPWNTLEMFNDPNQALEQWYCLFKVVL